MRYILNGVDYSECIKLARDRVFDPMNGDVAETLISSLHSDVTNLSHSIGGIGLNNPGTSFVENVTSTIHTASLLYNTLFGSVLMDSYSDCQKERRSEAESKLKRSLTDREEASIQASALSDLKDPIRVDAVKIQTLRRVNLIWDRPIIATSGPQVLRQGTVLIWGAFEVLSKDLSKIAVSNSVFLSKIMSSDSCRVACSVSLSAWNGQASWPQNIEKINSLKLISAVYEALLPASDTLTWFTNTHLKMLEQRRHLIVHRGGVVDQEYIDKSGDTRTIGDFLEIKPADFLEYVKVVIEIGTQMLQAVNAEF